MGGPQKLRVDLSLSIGENKEYYKRMVKEDKLSGLQLQVVQLSDQISQIQKEQDFQRYREEGFRKISEILNSRVLWWAVIQNFISELLLCRLTNQIKIIGIT